ncbi:hypothetical protein DIJ64_02725 [Mycobacterium leprae]|uniref:Transposase n=1 Tax=Mycobacterium leprae TaxID=1769 RepID=A0AAD0KU53_MYCLR|nr:hypothetical protein [Mycobacterium leprae]AWV47395.1 hypothetical protein DIJ64_02725 [Mycobacterium leprae]OAR20233.1 hypothetical protein A8144_03010 [Mycobacterium leprae 3125609]OAX71162.1 hypothetical protein A3216_07395 [Mycobacterium leprae 7935681]
MLADLFCWLILKKIPYLTKTLDFLMADQNTPLARLQLAHIDGFNLMINRLKVRIDSTVTPRSLVNGIL